MLRVIWVRQYKVSTIRLILQSPTHQLHLTPFSFTLAMSSTTYNLHQQVFGLSLGSNLLHGAQNQTLPQLQKAIETQLPSRIKECDEHWEVVWGPVVWMNKDNKDGAPDNVWYIAHHPQVQFPDGKTTDLYVVAIAGTATHSDYDEKREDYDVNAVVDINKWIQRGLLQPPPITAPSEVNDSQNTYISKGTAEGLTALLTTKVPSDGTAVGQGTLLTEFLGGIPGTARLVFTGHSLGGALSPALAVAWWIDSAMPKQVTAGNVFTYPTAGPSPGNLNFRSLFQKTFPAINGPRAYQSWNQNIVNTLDVVPLAWCTNSEIEHTQNLYRIRKFYHPTLIHTVSLIVLVSYNMVPHANESGVIFRPLPSSSFTGKGPLPYPHPKDPRPKKGKPFLPQWMRDASYCHVDQYAKEIGVHIPIPPSTLGWSLTEYQVAARWPLLREVGRASYDPRIIDEIDEKAKKWEKEGEVEEGQDEGEEVEDEELVKDSKDPQS